MSPNQSGQTLRLTVIVTNNSIGTVPIYYSPDQVRIGDDGISSGLALCCTGAGALPAGSGGTGIHPEEDIRLLGPRQSCVHTAEWAFEQITALGLTAGQTHRQSLLPQHYAGKSASCKMEHARFSFADQGLWVGIVELNGPDPAFCKLKQALTE